MYIKKNAERRTKPWGTKTLTKYSCEDFPSRTTQSHLSLRKCKIKPNFWPGIPLEQKKVRPPRRLAKLYIWTVGEKHT